MTFKKTHRNTLALKAALVAAVAVVAFALAGCGTAGTSSTNDTVIKVGASPTPHAEILKAVKDELAAKGYTLEVVEYQDYIQPNVALNDGDLDANYFQHAPYLDNYNEQNKTDLVSIGAIHFEPMSLYAGKSSDLSAIADGAKIAVPSDATNEARALLLLQDQGILKLKDGAGLEATTNDIVENPYHVQFIEVEAASVARQLQDADFAIVNGNFAQAAGLDSSKVLVSESAQSEAAKTYANVVAVRAADKDSAKSKALYEALTSDTARQFIESTYNGAVVPVF
ncbi:ABC-type metal ion transport system, periplasmic component/surface antigen [Cryptobacterium curtum DSM 15641]|uniref:Lipoprotein n=1 Tax=Cryptobacterium curtum (strain ATCC 700683 / DSM 15641 / CCUG 43107 / 12-3) TaxID=469378 RepID=C7MNN8_CRYCD|nr:MetQ/NlpA family ABC transporter substrate-binding protein [Cryptobacterium curtum]ACU94528.1 ABC-type metal ion transport system, periplasmic component/surface antigen [Cryptobacterium curtum DSM 15641]